jgi:hypothetical protein
LRCHHNRSVKNNHDRLRHGLTNTIGDERFGDPARRAHRSIAGSTRCSSRLRVKLLLCEASRRKRGRIALLASIWQASFEAGLWLRVANHHDTRIYDSLESAFHLSVMRKPERRAEVAPLQGPMKPSRLNIQGISMPCRATSGRRRCGDRGPLASPHVDDGSGVGV